MKRTIALYALLCLLALPLWAQSESQIKEKINRAAAQLKTMQCDFVQTKQIRLLNDRVVSKGKMCYQQTDKLRWEYVSPTRYTFILNGSQVLLTNERRNDVIDVNRNKMFKEIARIMMNSVVGKCLSDDKNFKVSLSTRETEYVATLVPLRKDLKALFQSIVLHFSRRQSMVNKVELKEKNGDCTTIELTNIKTNGTLPPNTFAVR